MRRLVEWNEDKVVNDNDFKLIIKWIVMILIMKWSKNSETWNSVGVQWQQQKMATVPGTRYQEYEVRRATRVLKLRVRKWLVRMTPWEWLWSWRRNVKMYTVGGIVKIYKMEISQITVGGMIEGIFQIILLSVILLWKCVKMYVV